MRGNGQGSVSHYFPMVFHELKINTGWKILFLANLKLFVNLKKIKVEVPCIVFVMQKPLYLFCKYQLGFSQLKTKLNCIKRVQTIMRVSISFGSIPQSFSTQKLLVKTPNVLHIAETIALIFVSSFVNFFSKFSASWLWIRTCLYVQ